MRNNTFKVLQAILLIVVIISASSFMNKNTNDTNRFAEVINDDKFDKNNSEKDAKFLVNAAEFNIEEISLGQLAQQKGNMGHVKELGKMMEVAHTKSLADLSALAKTKNISLPTLQTENGKDDYKKLSEKSTDNFDKSYADMMVNEHKKAIELFEKASTDCTDPDIKAWAAASLPTLRKHLDHAMACQKKM